jgi:hypothetical protein
MCLSLFSGLFFQKYRHFLASLNYSFLFSGKSSIGFNLLNPDKILKA